MLEEVLHAEVLAGRQIVVHFRDTVRKKASVLFDRKHFHIARSPVLFNGWREQRRGILPQLLVRGDLH